MNEVGFAQTIQERAGYLDIHGHESFFVVINSGARDGGPSGGNNSKELLPGTLLGKITTGGHYKDYDTDGADGTQLEENCVILLEPIKDISTGHQRGHVAMGGVVRFNQLRFKLAADKTGFITDLGKAPFGTI